MRFVSYMFKKMLSGWKLRKAGSAAGKQPLPKSGLLWRKRASNSLTRMRPGVGLLFGNSVCRHDLIVLDGPKFLTCRM